MNLNLRKALYKLNNPDALFQKTKELTWETLPDFDKPAAKCFKREIKKVYPNSRVYVRMTYMGYNVTIKFNSEADEAEFMLKEIT